VQQWGLRGVAWRLDGPHGRFWRIDVAIDSTGAVRRYYEDRYGYTAGRMIIRVDFEAGQARRRTKSRASHGRPPWPIQVRYFTHRTSTIRRRAPLASSSVAEHRSTRGVCSHGSQTAGTSPEPRPSPRIPSIDRTFQNPGLGVGYLKAVDGAVVSTTAFQWLQQLILPLYEEVGGRPSAWLARGWLAQPGAQHWRWDELAVGGWIGTGYDAPIGFCRPGDARRRLVSVSLRDARRR